MSELTPQRARGRGCRQSDRAHLCGDLEQTLSRPHTLRCRDQLLGVLEFSCQRDQTVALCSSPGGMNSSRLTHGSGTRLGLLARSNPEPLSVLFPCDEEAALVAPRPAGRGRSSRRGSVAPVSVLIGVSSVPTVWAAGVTGNKKSQAGSLAGRKGGLRKPKSGTKTEQRQFSSAPPPPANSRQGPRRRPPQACWAQHPVPGLTESLAGST